MKKKIVQVPPPEEEKEHDERHELDPGHPDYVDPEVENNGWDDFYGNQTETIDGMD